MFWHLNQYACAARTATLQDIHKPEPARLRRHLSAIINFAKFREEKLVVYRWGQYGSTALQHLACAVEKHRKGNSRPAAAPGRGIYSYPSC
jgi:hypothetical protein